MRPLAVQQRGTKGRTPLGTPDSFLAPCGGVPAESVDFKRRSRAGTDYWSGGTDGIVCVLSAVDSGIGYFLPQPDSRNIVGLFSTECN